MIAIRESTKVGVNERNEFRRNDTVKCGILLLHKEAGHLLGGCRFDTRFGDRKFIVNSRHSVLVDDDHRLSLMHRDEIVQDEVLMPLIAPTSLVLSKPMLQIQDRIT